MTMDSTEMSEVKSALEKGNVKQARYLLRRILRHDRYNTTAWLLFAGVAVNKIQKVYCLEQVLLLDPDNEKANQLLLELRSEGKTAPPIVTQEAREQLPEEEVPPAPELAVEEREAEVLVSEPLFEPPSELPPEAVVEPEVTAVRDELPEAETEKAPQAGGTGEKNCPYVGLASDRLSLAAFPNAENVCYRVKPPKGVSLRYQQSFCLSPNHVYCELLQPRQRKNSLLSVLINKAEKGK